MPARDERGDGPSYLALERGGELARREAALWEIFKSCALCPRSCGVNRLAGEKGRCGATAQVKVHSAGPHFGEEWPLVGTSGSGTVFFSNCNLLCCFCQNWEINHRGDGKIRIHEQLARMMLDLQGRGCKNINLVTPTHVAPNIVKSLRIAIKGGLKVPLVYNTGGYDSLEVIRLLDGIVDIYLPDFKYQDEKMALKYSSDAVDYPKVAAAGIKEMYRQVGNLKTAGMLGGAERGLMLRHLVMPNNIAGTDRFIRWVARELSPRTYTNLMDQYRPAHKAFGYPEIARRINEEEWQKVLTWAKQAGLKRVES
ncbi:MAG: radical SAM protein [Deltaproteobacteria bacterium]|nr:radical SAM protein [Deltaproteobacteria bacterium]